MKKLKKTVDATPFLGHLLLIPRRARIAMTYFREPAVNVVKWLFNSKETGNFTYDLEETNKRYLASLIADITGAKYEVIVGYMKELEEDSQLRDHVARETKKSGLDYMADKEVRFGRRIGWYALTRVHKPRVVIETGVDKGVGACVLVTALERNRHEGYEGRYYGTDINPHAGYLLPDDGYGCILYGDSIESLENLDAIVDLFINDSDHSADYEAREYNTIAEKLSENAIILGDNSHCTDKLLEFSLATGRQFVFFQERPAEHWYPGAGIGISFRRDSSV